MRVPWARAGAPHFASERRSFVDPVTGDRLTLSEEISWLLQVHVLRRWSFLLAFTVISAGAWALGSVTQFDWNYLMSWLAVMIEGTVALALFGAMRRDQVVIRETLRGVKLLDDVTKAHQAADAKRDEILEKLDELLRQKQGGDL